MQSDGIQARAARISALADWKARTIRAAVLSPRCVLLIMVTLAVAILAISERAMGYQNAIRLWVARPRQDHYQPWPSSCMGQDQLVDALEVVLEKHDRWFEPDGPAIAPESLADVIEDTDGRLAPLPVLSASSSTDALTIIRMLSIGAPFVMRGLEGTQKLVRDAVWRDAELLCAASPALCDHNGTRWEWEGPQLMFHSSTGYADAERDTQTYSKRWSLSKATRTPAPLRAFLETEVERTSDGIHRGWSSGALSLGALREAGLIEALTPETDATLWSAEESNNAVRMAFASAAIENDVVHLRLGREHNVFVFHRDNSANWLVGVAGRKRAVLLHPYNAYCLQIDENETRDSWRQSPMPVRDARAWLEVNCPEEYFDPPLALQHVFEEGDVLYIPPHWIHHVDTRPSAPGTWHATMNRFLSGQGLLCEPLCEPPVGRYKGMSMAVCNSSTLWPVLPWGERSMSIEAQPAGNAPDGQTSEKALEGRLRCDVDATHARLVEQRRRMGADEPPFPGGPRLHMQPLPALLEHDVQSPLPRITESGDAVSRLLTHAAPFVLDLRTDEMVTALRAHLVDPSPTRLSLWRFMRRPSSSVERAGITFEEVPSKNTLAEASKELESRAQRLGVDVADLTLYGSSGDLTDAELALVRASFGRDARPSLVIDGCKRPFETSDRRLASMRLRTTFDEMQVFAHFDHQPNLLLGLAGVKRVILFHPLEFTVDNIELSSNSRQMSINRTVRELAESHPGALALQAWLRPGEALHIPALWWHAIDTVDDVDEDLAEADGDRFTHARWMSLSMPWNCIPVDLERSWDDVQANRTLLTRLYEQVTSCHFTTLQELQELRLLKRGSAVT